MYETLPPYVYSMGGSSCHSLSRKKGRERGTHLLPFPGGKREDNFLPTQEERRGRKTAAKKKNKNGKLIKRTVSNVFLLFLKNALFQKIFFSHSRKKFFSKTFFSPRPCCSVSGTDGRREEKGWKGGRGKVFRPPPALPPPAFSDGRKRERESGPRRRNGAVKKRKKGVVVRRRRSSGLPPPPPLLFTLMTVLHLLQYRHCFLQ